MTFLNVPQLDGQGADLQTKIEELQIINQSLREKNDKMKEDIIANLSDKLIVLSEKLKKKKHDLSFKDKKNLKYTFEIIYYLIVIALQGIFITIEGYDC